MCVFYFYFSVHFSSIYDQKVIFQHRSHHFTQYSFLRRQVFHSYSYSFFHFLCLTWRIGSVRWNRVFRSTWNGPLDICFHLCVECRVWICRLHPHEMFCFLQMHFTSATSLFILDPINTLCSAAVNLWTSIYIYI